MEEYRNLRKSSKRLIREDYKNHVEEIEEKIKIEPENFWKHINSKRIGSNTSIAMSYKGTNQTEISSAFATHFSSVFGISDPSVDLGDTEGMGGYSSLHIDLGELTMEDVCAAMKRMKPKRRLGPDGVPAYIYKACKDLLAEPLTHIFNVMIKTTVIPRSWVVSKVTPDPKGNETQDIANHRPVVGIPTPMKIFE